MWLAARAGHLNASRFWGISIVASMGSVAEPKRRWAPRADGSDLAVAEVVTFWDGLETSGRALSARSGDLRRALSGLGSTGFASGQNNRGDDAAPHSDRRTVWTSVKANSRMCLHL